MVATYVEQHQTPNCLRVIQMFPHQMIPVRCRHFAKNWMRHLRDAGRALLCKALHQRDES